MSGSAAGPGVSQAAGEKASEEEASHNGNGARDAGDNASEDAGERDYSAKCSGQHDNAEACGGEARYDAKDGTLGRAPICAS